MSDDIYSIDRALEKSRPKIELRGDVYEIRDFTVEERLSVMAKMKKRQERLQESLDEDTETGFDKLQELVAEAAQKILVGLPDEVAQDITESEFQTLMNTVAEVRNQPVVAERIDPDEESGKEN